MEPRIVNTKSLNNGMNGYPVVHELNGIKLPPQIQDGHIVDVDELTSNRPYDIDVEYKQLRRRMRNKLSAQESRKRKREYIESLHKKLKQTCNEKATLQTTVREIKEEKKLLEDKIRQLLKERERNSTRGCFSENEENRSIEKINKVKKVQQTSQGVQVGVCLACYRGDEASTSTSPSTNGIHKHNDKDIKTAVSTSTSTFTAKKDQNGLPAVTLPIQPLLAPKAPQLPTVSVPFSLKAPLKNMPPLVRAPNAPTNLPELTNMKEKSISDNDTSKSSSTSSPISTPPTPMISNALINALKSPIAKSVNSVAQASTFNTTKLSKAEKEDTLGTKSSDSESISTNSNSSSLSDINSISNKSPQPTLTPTTTLESVNTTLSSLINNLKSSAPGTNGLKRISRDMLGLVNPKRICRNFDREQVISAVCPPELQTTNLLQKLKEAPVPSETPELPDKPSAPKIPIRTLMDKLAAEKGRPNEKPNSILMGRLSEKIEKPMTLPSKENTPMPPDYPGSSQKSVPKTLPPTKSSLSLAAELSKQISITSVPLLSPMLSTDQIADSCDSSNSSTSAAPASLPESLFPLALMMNSSLGTLEKTPSSIETSIKTEKDSFEAPILRDALSSNSASIKVDKFIPSNSMILSNDSDVGPNSRPPDMFAFDIEETSITSPRPHRFDVLRTSPVTNSYFSRSNSISEEVIEEGYVSKSRQSNPFLMSYYRSKERSSPDRFYHRPRSYPSMTHEKSKYHQRPRRFPSLPNVHQPAESFDTSNAFYDLVNARLEANLYSFLQKNQVIH